MTKLEMSVDSVDRGTDRLMLRICRRTPKHVHTSLVTCDLIDIHSDHKMRPNNARKKCIRTNLKTVLAARLKQKSGDSDKGEKTARYDEVHGVVERLAT